MYNVKFVKGDELPDGYDWFIARRGCDFVFMVNPDGLTEQTLEDAWVAFCKLQATL